MGCKNCEKNSVNITLNHEKQCKNCFIKYFERKVHKNVSKYKMIPKEGKMNVPVRIFASEKILEKEKIGKYDSNIDSQLREIQEKLNALQK